MAHYLLFTFVPFRDAKRPLLISIFWCSGRVDAQYSAIGHCPATYATSLRGDLFWNFFHNTIISLFVFFSFAIFKEGQNSSSGHLDIGQARRRCRQGSRHLNVQIICDSRLQTKFKTKIYYPLARHQKFINK